MAEPRKKTHSILLSISGRMVSLELFDACLWPDQNTTEGLFRVRIEGKWYSPNGKYTFLSFSAVGGLVAQIMAGQDLVKEETAPKLCEK